METVFFNVLMASKFSMTGSGLPMKMLNFIRTVLEEKGLVLAYTLQENGRVESGQWNGTRKVILGISPY